MHLHGHGSLIPMSGMPSDETVAAWTALMRAQRRALGVIEAALKAAGLPALAVYDALLEIERAGEEGLRPFQLEPRLLLPQYGLSRLLDRLAADGLVRRRPAPKDRRGHVVVISPQGRALRARMWPVYARALERAFGCRLDPGEAATLAKLLRRVAAEQAPDA